jgi:tetratricopeptide (TPR) repeat protein
MKWWWQGFVGGRGAALHQGDAEDMTDASMCSTICTVSSPRGRAAMTEAATFSLSHRDYFISRSTVDVAFAGWIGKLIAAQGKTYIEQSEHFGHEDFMNAMHKAFLSGARIVALYSQSYLDSRYCVREATEALKGDPANEQQRLIPLRIEPCAPAGMLNITYTDLLAERRQADASALASRICRALGLAAPDLSRLPPFPEGLLVAPARLIHPQIRISRTDLAPRPELMAQIASAMSRAGGNSQHIAAAVAGMAGAGKTVLARSFAVEHQDAYHGVWWIDAERRDATGGNMLADIAALGAKLSERIKTEAQTNLEEAARDTLRLIETVGYARPFLLVYDNVKRPEDIEYWTPRSGAHILLTTRYAEWDDMVAKVEVGTLARETAIEFLLKRGKKKPEEREAAGRLADALDCLPLALDHAASYCALGRRPSFDEYFAMLASRLDYEPAGTSAVYGRSVRKTFAIALQRVIDGDATLKLKPCPDAERVMGVAVLLAPVPIPFALFSHPSLRTANVDGAFRSLAEVSLIATGEDDRGNGTFSVHRLVQKIMCDRLAKAELVADCTHLGVELLATGLPDNSDDFGSWETCKALTPHALAVLAIEFADEQSQRSAAVLAFKTVKYLQRVARYSEAEALAKRSLPIVEKIVGPDDPSLSTMLFLMADNYFQQGRFSEAEPLMKRSLAINEKALGPDHPSSSAARDAVAVLYQLEGRFSEAEPLMKRSLAINEETFGPDDPSGLRTLGGVAMLYYAQGRYSEAEPLMKRSLAITEKTVGPDHPDTSSMLRLLGRLYQIQDRHSEAEQLLERSMEVTEKSLGLDHPDTSEAMQALAVLYLERGRYSEAEQLLKRSMEVIEKSLGFDHPATSGAMRVPLSGAGALSGGRDATEAVDGALRENCCIRSSLHGVDLAQHGWPLSGAGSLRGGRAAAEAADGALRENCCTRSALFHGVDLAQHG